MKTTKLLLAAVALATALLSATAKAQSLTAYFIEITPGQPVYGTVDGNFYQDWASGVASFDGFDAFCVEPGQPLSYGETVIYQYQDASTLVNSATVAKLIGGFLASDMSPAQAAAVQWAIWETVTETTNPPSLFDGNVKITGADDVDIATIANQYLLDVDTFTPVTLTYLSNDTRQDVVTWQVVPEPATAGLAALSALMLIRRRRR